MPESRTPVTVARLINWLPVGGIERKIVKVLTGLDRARFRPIVICLRERGPLADDLERAGVPVYTIPLRSRLDPASLWRLARLMQREQVEIVHTHMYRANTSGTISARIAKRPVTICHIHNVDTWETRRQLMLDRILTRYRDAVIAVSQAVAVNYGNRVPAAKEKLHVIYNGVDPEEFYPGAGTEVREELGISPDETILGVTGRLVGQKGHDLLWRACQNLTQFNWRLLIAGGGPCRADLERLARELGIQSRLIFLGIRNDMPRIMRALDLLVLPSRREGFANVILEAMATGLPAVVSDAGGNAEAVLNGETGFVVPPDNVGALTNSLRILLTQPELRKRMARRALERSRLFSIGEMITRTQQLYEQRLQAVREQGGR